MRLQNWLKRVMAASWSVISASMRAIFQPLAQPHAHLRLLAGDDGGVVAADLLEGSHPHHRIAAATLASPTGVFHSMSARRL